MFFRRAVDHGVEKKRARREMNHGRAGDAEWVDVSARKT